jgi:hypothetical protein
VVLRIENLIFHAINALLVFFLLQRSFPERLAFFGGLAFAVHPVGADVAGWVAGRGDALATMCVLGSMMLLPRKVMLAGFLAGLSLWAKESTLMFPVVAVVFYMNTTAPRAGFMVGVVSMWILKLGFLLTTPMLAIDKRVAPVPYLVLNAVFRPALVLGKIILPTDLSPEYVPGIDPGWLIHMTIGVLALLLWFRREPRGMIAFLLMNYPAGLGHLLGNRQYADGFAYLPLVFAMPFLVDSFHRIAFVIGGWARARVLATVLLLALYLQAGSQAHIRRSIALGGHYATARWQQLEYERPPLMMFRSFLLHAESLRDPLGTLDLLTKLAQENPDRVLGLSAPYWQRRTDTSTLQQRQMMWHLLSVGLFGKSLPDSGVPDVNMGPAGDPMLALQYLAWYRAALPREVVPSPDTNTVFLLSSYWRAIQDQALPSDLREAISLELIRLAVDYKTAGVTLSPSNPGVPAPCGASYVGNASAFIGEMLDRRREQYSAI